MSREEIERPMWIFFTEHGKGIAAVYVFGSVARGTAGSASDIDLAVLFERPPPETLAGLRFDLADDLTELLDRKVDLVILDRADVDLIYRVLRDSWLVYEGYPSRRISFEVRARNEYFDLLPYLEQYRRAGARP